MSGENILEKILKFHLNACCVTMDSSGLEGEYHAYCVTSSRLIDLSRDFPSFQGRCLSSSLQSAIRRTTRHGMQGGQDNRS